MENCRVDIIHPEIHEENDSIIDKISDNISYCDFRRLFAGKENHCSIGRKSVKIDISSETSNQLIKISNNSDLSLYILLITILKCAIYKYTQNSISKILIPIYKQKKNRSNSKDYIIIQDTINESMTIRELILDNKKIVLEAYENKSHSDDSPMVVLADNESKNHCNTVCLLDSLHGSYEIKSEDDIVFTFNKVNTDVSGQINFEMTNNDEKLITGFSDHLSCLIEYISKNYNHKLCDIDIVQGSDRKKIIEDFNKTDVIFQEFCGLHQLFESQVEKNPDNIVLISGERRISYKELNELSNRIGRLILEKGIKPDETVGLISNRGIEMVAAILGILKSGAVFVPIDGGYPVDRINHIINESKMKLLLNVNGVDMERISDCEKVNLGYLSDNKAFNEIDCNNLAPINHSHNLAYIIFTSGSTGLPKGVMIEHKSIINTILWRKNEYGLNDKDRVLQLFHFTFDGFLTSLFTPIASGSQVVLLSDEEAKNPLEIKRYIYEYKITHFISVPILYHSVLECSTRRDLESVKVVTLAGDQIRAETIALSMSLNDKIEIANEYGPTECSVATTIKRSITEKTRAIIGRPISNTKLYILGNNSKLQPIGAYGELYISGIGVAHGYLNNAALNDKVFTGNPYSLGEKMYKTGDLARWLPNGEVEFSGRIDFQVKIRGFRIELKEIEANILGCKGVLETIVICNEDNNHNKLLCAFIIMEKGTFIDDVKKCLHTKLPDFMIPQSFFEIDKMPINSNHKIDRKALENIIKISRTKKEYTAPKTSTEEKMVNVWKEILNVEKIGTDQNFFEIGGHSLKATVLLSKVHKIFDVDMPLTQLFDTPTIETLSDVIDKSRKQKIINIPKVDIQPYYPVSSAQKRMYYLNSYYSIDIGYNIPFAMVIEGTIDIQRFENIFKTLCSRHEILQTSFALIDGSLVQIINKSSKINLSYLICSEREIEKKIHEFIRPFDLSKAPLLRAEILKISDNKNILLMDMHHIVSDGISVGILFNDIIKLYNGFELKPIKIQYKDFAVWQNNLLCSNTIKEQEKYWKRNFEGEIPMLNLPIDKKRPPVFSFKGDKVVLNINKRLTNDIITFTNRSGITPFMYLLSAYYVLLSKYCQQNDIVVGTPVAGREHPDLYDTMGMFVNTLAIRCNILPDEKFNELLLRVKKKTLEAMENQTFQFEDLIKVLNIENNQDRSPLFDTMFVMQNVDIPSIKLDGLKIYQYDFELKVAKFDLLLDVKQGETGMELEFEYCTELFTENVIEQMGNHYLNILEIAAYQPDIQIKDIKMLSSQDKKRILIDFNDNHQEKATETLVEMCKKSFSKYPTAIAIIDAKGTYTYQEIREYSYCVAGFLHDQGFSKPNSLIGVLSEKGYQQVVSTLGIMQSGAAYLPLNIEWPRGRVDEVLKEGAVETVLVSLAEFENNIKDRDIEVKYTWLIIEEIIGYTPKVAVEALHPASLEDIAYVIFTSGSTGKPKGVVISHSGAVNTIKAVNARFSIGTADKVLALSDLSFDLSVYDIFGLLAAGATIVFPDQKKSKDPVHWHDIVEKHGITVWNTVPQLMRLLVNYVSESRGKLDTLKVVLMSGDWIPLDLPGRIKVLHEETTVMSLGGATEGSIWSIWYEVKIVEPTWSSIPYGRAMPNQKMYVLDEFGEHCPIGVTGDIYIGGEGVALGYWNDKEKTQAVFIHHESLGRIYKTGDIGKWNSAGYIVFEGRKDTQVKINGYRIELGEIEHALCRIAGIKQSCVLVKERQTETGITKYLVGYYVLNDNENKVSQSIIFDTLHRMLPEYMVPSVVMAMESFPLTVNGKLDKRALPEPDFAVSKEEYVAPVSGIETEMCEIWRQILGVEKVGVTDDFFRIGGHSISAIQVSHRMSETLNREILVADLFKYKTINNLLSIYMEKKSKMQIVGEDWKI